MKMALSACFAVLAQAFAQCAALAADVMPVWQNDTVANTLSFQDTFGHQVSIGTYNSSTGTWSTAAGSISIGATFTGGLLSIAGSPITGPSGTLAFTVAGTSGGIPYFASGSTWASSGVLAANQIVLGGGAGAAPSTPLGLGTTTQLLHGNASGAPSFGPVSDADITAALTTPPPIGLTTPGVAAFSDRTRSLQSFGAVGDGVTNDTTAVQTALNSGLPLACVGKFVFNSLVTITNVNVAMYGGGGPGCTLILNNAQAMLYSTLTGASNYNANTFKMHDVKISVNAVITSVTGPAQTAAIFITYPLGTAGDNLPLVDIDNVSVKPTTNTNYILNGIYLNDATNVWIKNFMYEGDVTAVQAGTTAIVFDGTHSPTNLHILDSYADLVGTGIAAITHATNSWQGIRVKGFDCVFCANIVSLAGGADGKSDYADLTGVEGVFNTNGIVVTNTTHVTMHNNYLFMSNVPGIVTPSFPTCFTQTWSVSVPSNGDGSNISANTCDGAQITGYTTRYGFALGGEPNMNDVLGVNQLSNLDTGISTASGTTGWKLQKQNMKSVTTEWTANETAGSEVLYPPFAVVDGTTQPAGLVGEVISANVVLGSPIGIANNTPKTITSISLSKGDWDCRGETDFAGTSTGWTGFAGSLSITPNTLSVPPAGSGNFITMNTNSATQYLPLASFVLNVSSTTPLYMVAYETYTGGSATAYGRVECRRMR